MNHENRDSCYYHPKQTLVGVCPLCLYDRLLVVEAQEARRSRLLRRRSYREGGGRSKSGNNVGVRKMFALRAFLNRLELRHRRRRSDEIGSDYQSTSTSLEDSFISIKFEGNGVASWDKTKDNFTKTNPKGLTRHDTDPKKPTNRVVEHAKTPRGSLRWRKRIGHLLQLVKWKKCSKGSGGTSHVDGVVNARSKGWMRTFTRRRTSKE